MRKPKSLIVRVIRRQKTVPNTQTIDRPGGFGPHVYGRRRVTPPDFRSFWHECHCGHSNTRFWMLTVWPRLINSDPRSDAHQDRGVIRGSSPEEGTADQLPPAAGFVAALEAIQRYTTSEINAITPRVASTDATAIVRLNRAPNPAARNCLTPR